MANQSNQNDNPAETADLMGYEQNTEVVTPQETTEPKDTQAIINDAIKEVTVGEDGKLVYPEGMDPMLKAAVAASKSFRDTQSGFTKAQMSLKESESENIFLKEQLAKQVGTLELTPEKAKELDDLMYTNPKAWRQEMNKLEAQASGQYDTQIEEVRTKSRADAELERRVNVLKEFNVGRETAITPDTLDNDIPARITNKLADGNITFEEYLEEVSTYLTKGKVVAQADPTTTTDLNKANGSSTAQPQTKKDGELDYADIAF